MVSAAGSDDVAWPIVLFDDMGSPAVVGNVDSIYNVREPHDIAEIKRAFDAEFRPIRIVGVDGYHFALERLSDSPDVDRFREVAREALKLHGPDAKWRWWRLVRPDSTDTTGWTAKQLWDAMADRFWIE